MRPFNNQTFDHMYCANCMCKLSIETSIHWINMCKALNYSCFDCACKTACVNADYIWIWMHLQLIRILHRIALHRFALYRTEPYHITLLNLTNDMTAHTKRTATEFQFHVITQWMKCLADDHVTKCHLVVQQRCRYIPFDIRI